MVDRSMVLPDVDTQGYVPDAWSRSLGDVRIPTPVETDGEVRTAGSYPRCTDEGPRHLWDILETVTCRDVQDERDDWHEETTFREVLTCVRCGLVQQREGTRRDRPYQRVAVEPIRAGRLLAQEVKRETFFSGDLSSYVVVDADGRQVGRISWSRGQRGRLYYVGFLGDEHPRVAGDRVEAPTAGGVLRKLARATANVEVGVR